MTNWFRRRQGRQADGDGERGGPGSGLEERVSTFGPYGRGLVSGADLTPSGRNDTAQTLYEQGKRDEALAIWRDLAEQGDADGTANMVIECSADGQYVEALKWWRRLDALRTGVPPHDPGVRLRSLGKADAAEGWWRTAAEKLKDDRSCEYLGISLRERGRGSEASRWLRQGAERGDGPCARELAGLAFERADQATDPVTREIHTEEAVKWTHAAAAAGDARARIILQQLEDGA